MESEQDLKIAYTFPNGFWDSAQSMYGWLRHANLNPSWGNSVEVGGAIIMLPDNEIDCLRMMQKANPARYGNAPPVDYFEPGWIENRRYMIAPMQIGGTISDNPNQKRFPYIAYNTETKQERRFQKIKLAMNWIERHWESRAKLWVRGVYKGSIPE